MQKLVDGVHSFRQDVFGDHAELFQKLAAGQDPIALFITCSDSRIDPALLMQTDPGELFILRVAGNIVPPYGAVLGGEACAVEYAVSVLGVKDIIVCGHSHCGAMAGLLKPESLDKLPAVRAALSHAAATHRIIQENYEHLSDADQRLAVTVEENVLVQLENLKTHPSVAAALSRKALKLHAWVYKFETGEVAAYDPDQGQYALID